MGAYGHPLRQSMLSLYCVSIGCIQTSSKHMEDIKTCQCPNIQGASKHMGVSKHMGASKHTGGIQMYGAYGHPLSLTKNAFFLLCMYRGHPNIWGAHHFLYNPELCLPSCFFLNFKYFNQFFKIFYL